MQHNPTKQNPLLFYLRMFLYTILALLLRVLTFAPLACLVLDGPVRWAALLCPVLLVFVVLPLRFSFAEALVQQPGDRSFRLGAAFSLRQYGEKLTESLMHVLHVAKWGIPLAVMFGYAFYWYNEVDALTLLKTITSIGEWWTNLCCTVVGFFGVEAVAPAAAMMDGVLVLLAVLGLGAAIWLYGAVRCSAVRYIWVVANRSERPLRSELRRRLRGRRLQQLGVGIINLLLLVPFAAVTLNALVNSVSNLSTQLMMVMAGGSLQLDLAGAVLPMAAAFALLYLPLVPVRRLLTARFAVRESKGAAVQQ